MYSILCIECIDFAVLLGYCYYIFFFKQKTAYEMRISDWSSDVCSSDLGLLSFTRISDALLRPMTLALCTNSARTPSYAAGLVLSEIENGFAQLSYSASMKRAEENRT